MALILTEPFISHSGMRLPFKIDCDALSNEDLDALAKIVSDKFTFCWTWGVPTGGERFAKALEKYTDATSLNVLIVDDVWTTGASVEKKVRELKSYDQHSYWGVPSVNYMSVVIFARGPTPHWVYPIFTLNDRFQ
jgi:hypothetical protein